MTPSTAKSRITIDVQCKNVVVEVGINAAGVVVSVTSETTDPVRSKHIAAINASLAAGRSIAMQLMNVLAMEHVLSAVSRHELEAQSKIRKAA